MSKNRAIFCEVDQKELKELTKALKKHPAEARKGVVAAVNKSLKTTNTAMQKAMTTRYKIQKKMLSGGDTFKSESSNNMIREKKATMGNLDATILVRGSRMALVVPRGMVSSKEPKSHLGKTVKQIKRLAPPKTTIIKGQTKSYRHAFVARGKGGTVGLFSRNKVTGKLEMQRTLSTASMAKEESVAAATQKAAAQALQKNAAHEIDWRLKKVHK